MALSPASQVGHYKILSPLGKGGMGEVYRARDPRLGREVAIKVLPERFAEDPNALARFEREAKALALMAHPNIVSIFDFGTHQGISYAVMEILEGETLRDLLRRSSLSWSKAVGLALPIAEGLAAAHSKGVIHRDLKPENIFITSDAQVKILDFGLARRDTIVSEEPQSDVETISRLTEAGTVIGTVPYMSPEQVRGDVIDARSDFFSFGCILYEMVTGQRPFAGNSSAEIIANILKDDPQKIDPGRKIPPELERIILRCLEKNADHRVQSSRDLAYDLKSILSHSSATEVSPVVIGRRSPSRLVLPILLILLIAGAAWWQRGKQLESKARGKSIAVLPFKNMSSDKESEYFCDGMTEDILTQLSKIGDLKVISRTSIMQYKNTNKTLREIGKELEVATVLEGSVRKEGNRLRIVGQLIDAKTDEHLWAETYDRDLKDVFEVQSDVAQRIADALQTKLSPGQQQQIKKKPTVNVTAYDFYLKGRDYYRRYHKQDNENAIELFRKALKLDPNYALAYSAICEAQMREPTYGFPEATSVDQAVESCNKAITIDPNLPEAYEALSKVYGYQGRAQESIEALKKAVNINPNYAPAIGNLGVSYLNQGKIDQSLPWTKRFATLEPAFAFPYLNLGEVYFALDDLPKAEQFLNKSLELQPDFVYPHETFLEMFLAQGKYQLAQDHADKALSIDPLDNQVLAYAGLVQLYSGNFERAKDYYQKSLGATPIPEYKIRLGYALLKLGQKDQARKLFQEAVQLDQDRIARSDETSATRYRIAQVNAIQNNKREALSWLERAVDAGWIYYRLMLRDPLFENLREDSQFQQIISRVKARVDEMRRKAERAAG
jgi:serine/threonine protein kinase/tetratricopeptide (TPR) repeat protein